MGKYTKRFATHSLYTDFKSSADYSEPNVSVCDDNLEVHYNKLRGLIKVTLSGTLGENLPYSPASVDIIKTTINGNEYNINDEYTLPQEYQNSNAVIEFYIYDDITSLSYNNLQDSDNNFKIVIPEGIETLDTFFSGLRGYLPAEVELPSTFKSCDHFFRAYAPDNSGSNFVKLTVKATTPPTLIQNALKYGGSSGGNYIYSNLMIYVPAESVDAYKAATGWSTYASKIQAIPS